MSYQIVDTTGRPVGLARLWPLLVFRGVLMTVFGLLMLVWPGATALVVISIFGIYAIVDGATSIGYGIRSRRNGFGGRGLIAQGVFAAVVGLIALLWPAATATVVLWIIGFWAVLIGGVLAAIGLGLRRGPSKFWLIPLIAGIVGIIFGLVLWFQPAASLVSLVVVLGIVTVFAGVMLVGGGLRIRRAQLA